MLVKNQNFRQKIGICVKTRNFGQKIGIYAKTRNFGQNIGIYAKTGNFGQKIGIYAKTLVKNQKFSSKKNKISAINPNGKVTKKFAPKIGISLNKIEILVKSTNCF